MATAVTDDRVPRGIRNHNPGNIEHTGERWQGLADPPSDGRFCRFAAPSWGIRAMARVLIAYRDRHGIDTIRGAIARWAPPVENRSADYAAFVARRCGLGVDARVDLADYAVLRPMVEAMILMENGVQPYTGAQIDKGLVLAGVEPPEKSLQKSRTVRGAQVAAGGTALTAASEAVAEVAAGVEPLVPYMDAMKWLFIAVTLIGLGVAVWARIDDRLRGLR